MSRDSTLKSVWFTCGSDDLINDAGIDEFAAWKAKTLAPPRIQELEQFVGNAMGHGGTATYVDEASGSYNIVLRFRLRPLDGAGAGVQGQQVALRIPMPGHTAAVLMPEKVENEVAWMQYFEEHAIAKVPHVHHWGASAENEIGHPFILMDYVDGERLSDCLLRWVQSTDRADKKRWRTAYEQLAALYLSLDRHRFDKIGSVAKTASGDWAITRRPLTHDMHTLLIWVPGAPRDAWPAGPLRSVAEYKSLVNTLQQTFQDGMRSINIPGQWCWDVAKTYHHRLQRGAAIDMHRAMKTARGRILSRSAYAHPACQSLFDSSRDSGTEKGTAQFKIFNPDLCARNILVDPDTAHITALIDLEFTNAMPAALADDPPLYLLPFPFVYFLKEKTYAEWWTRYKPGLDAFLIILEDLGKKQQQEHQTRETPLSKRMRDSIESMQWLINYGYNWMEIADMIYWDQRHLFPPVDEARLETIIQEYQAHTKNQIALYEEARTALEKKE
ncbi:Protein kinase-like domain protein [Niveomyces insectorum RCEF 264]|uniref:Protein kinase-like domain protein n=1 Tax=Niveomyces insectorum RCEF 264 TaxID=1081102 RepID=A0A162I9N8_9HYPO|nr:Protein kinase-like domain protein [Niveomyces insectorum RCEF 264]